MALAAMIGADQLDLEQAGGRGWFAWRLPSGELATMNGSLLAHRSQHEMQWLLSGGRPIPVPESWRHGPFLALSAHPDLAAIRWPLQVEDFK